MALKTTASSSREQTKRTNTAKQSQIIHKSAYQLVIVESPSKASTISSILNNHAQKHSLPYDFIVDSCKGHVRDLPESSKDLSNAPIVYTPSMIHGDVLDNLPQQEKKEYLSPVLGVRIANKSYDPIYIILPQKIETVRHLQKLASKQNGCVGIILATDEDREGEAIAYHLSQILSPSSSGMSSLPPMRRVTFNEITKGSIESAFFSVLNQGINNKKQEELPLNMEDILDMDLVQAQETRRILDRLAGYPMSLLLCKKIAPGLSAGRVQSVGLSLIVNRERERMTFKQSEYYDIQATLDLSLNNSLSTFQATLIKINQTRIATGRDFDPQTGLLYQHTRAHINETNMKLNDDNTDNITSRVYHLTKDNIENILTRIQNSSRWTVTLVERKEKSFSPPLPFTTSTLQQEANKRIGLSVSDTMKGAQMLYEAGLISYMRTDSNHLSEDAINASKIVVLQSFGSTYLNQESNQAKTKRKKKGGVGNKLAQEAHEAIRPSIQSDGSFISPQDIAMHYTRESNGYELPESLFKIYKLIYDRTVSYFMKSQIMEQTSVFINCETVDGFFNLTFRASGSVMVFDGFTKLTKPIADILSDNIEEDRPKYDYLNLLPKGLEKGKELLCREAVFKAHVTKPPPRYSEASFVKELEALGVGRPSTYASVVQTLKSRFYIGSDSNKTARRNGISIRGSAISASRAAGISEVSFSGNGPLVPSLSAFAVCSLLEKYCPTYVDPKFTSKMEERLDCIADGDNSKESRQAYLEEYYGGSEGLAAQVEKINQELSGDEVRRVDLPTLKSDKVGIFIGPWGAYIKRLHNQSKSPQVAQLPLDMTADISSITDESLEAILASKENNGHIIGLHPDDGRPVRLRIGRFGAYLQWGEQGEKNTTNHSLPKNFHRLIDSCDITNGTNVEATMLLEDAIAYINLPRVVSEMNGIPITAGLGPYGPYLKYNNTYTGLKQEDGDILSIQAHEAEEIILNRLQRSAQKTLYGVASVLGEKEGSPITLKLGRFGTYINWKNINVRLPSTFNTSSLTTIQLQQAWELISNKLEKDQSSNTGKRGIKASKLISTTIKEESIPPRPRRPMSAYLYFCAEKRPDVSKTVKSLSEISKAFSTMWSQLRLVPKGIEPYEVQASQAKARYEQEMTEWRRLCDPISTKNETSFPTNNTAHALYHDAHSKESLQTTVKRSPSAYMIFCRENRDKVSINADGERLRLGDVTKHLAKLWKECDEETKDEYRVKAKQFAASSMLS